MHAVQNDGYRVTVAVKRNAMQHVLKILSGSLSGVEYALSSDETLFHVGPHADLINGKAERILGGAENAFFLPADLPAAAFLIRVESPEEAAELRIGERDDEQSPWRWRTLPLQRPDNAAQVHFAVRASDEPWSSAVMDFVVPSLPAAMTSDPHPAENTAADRRMAPAMLLGSIALVMVAVSAAWFYWHYQPEVRVRGLASILQDAPADYQIVPGEKDHLYVFADGAADKAWAERASRRLQRQGDRYVVRHEEVRRLEAILLSAGIDLVVVRLQQPTRPKIIVSGLASAQQVEKVERALAGQIPWRHQLQVGTISDQQLISLARQRLRVQGGSTRTEPQGRGTSVVNDVFLDDAALSAMTATAAAFHAEWGRRRISIQPQLWDDLLQGRSYRYSPGQLLSVGGGRWGYAGAVGQHMQAAP